MNLSHFLQKYSKISIAVLVTLLPEKVNYIIMRYRFGNAMGDNRVEAYLQNPLSKMAILLKRLPNGADILASVYL